MPSRREALTLPLSFLVGEQQSASADKQNEVDGWLAAMPSAARATEERFSRDVVAIKTYGYEHEADGGGALYRRSPVQPAHHGAFRSADGAWWEYADTRANVLAFGQRGTGIDLAADVARTKSIPLWFPPGEYIYTGNGLDLGSIWTVRGDGLDVVRIVLPPNVYFIDVDLPFDAINLEGISFDGGAGVIRNRSRSHLVGRRKLIRDNCFRSYTHAAIAVNSTDNPYWLICSNQFDGANSHSTIGVALGSNADASSIVENQFLRNRIHIKLAGSGFVSIARNDFIQFDKGEQRAAIWIACTAEMDHVEILANKLGNENQSTTDYRILVAPEGEGALTEDRLPDISKLESKGLHRVVVKNNLIGGSTGCGSLIYTTAAVLRGSTISENTFSGSAPRYIIEYANPLDALGAYELIHVGDNWAEEAITVRPLELSNNGSVGSLFDPRQLSEGDSRTPHAFSGAGQDGVGYHPLLQLSVPEFKTIRATLVASATDATHDRNAAEFLLQEQGEIYAEQIIEPGPASALWVEFDLMGGSSAGASAIEAQIFGVTDSTKAFWIRRVTVPRSWQRFRYLVTGGVLPRCRFRFVGLVPGRVKIGRVHIYHAREPVLTGAATFQQLNLSALPGSPENLPSGYLWADANADHAVKRTASASAVPAVHGQLTPKRGTIGPGQKETLWSIGLSAGEPAVLFAVEIALNPVGTAVQQLIRAHIPAFGGIKDAGFVERLGAVEIDSNSRAPKLTERLSITLRHKKLEIEVVPGAALHYAAIGRWICNHPGNHYRTVLES